jgi:hypothetical protein
MTSLLFRRIDIAWMRERIGARSEAREEVEDEGSERKLHQHVHARREEWKAEIEMLGGEHPFVVDGDGE